MTEILKLRVMARTTRDNTDITTPDDQSEPQSGYQPDIKLPGGEYFMMAFTNPAYPMVTVTQKDEANGDFTITNEDLIIDKVGDPRWLK